jgi:hypothetical protein
MNKADIHSGHSIIEMPHNQRKKKLCSVRCSLITLEKLVKVFRAPGRGGSWTLFPQLNIYPITDQIPTQNLV